MACRIDKVLADDLKESQLFKELSQELPPDLALERYLTIKGQEQGYKELYGENSQGEPDVVHIAQFRLDEFHTYREQQDTMEYLADAIITRLQEAYGAKDDTVLGGINLKALTENSTILPSIMESIAQDTILMSTYDKMSQRQSELLVNAAVNARQYLFNDERLGPLGRKLAEYGIHIRPSKTQTADIEVYTESEIETMMKSSDDSEYGRDMEIIEMEFERIYDMKVEEISSMSSVLDGVRTYIKSKRTDEISELGRPKFVDYGKVMSHLFKKFAGVQTIDQMITVVGEEIANMPELRSIYEDLINEKPITIKTSAGEMQYKKLATALFSVAKQNYNMFTIAKTHDGTVLFTPSNRDTVENRLITKWEQGVFNSSKMSKEEIKRVKADLDKFMADPNTKINLNKITDKSAMAEHTLATFFNKAGFLDVTKEHIRNMRNVLRTHRKLKGIDKDVTKSFYEFMNNYVKAVIHPSLNGKDVFRNTVEGKGETKLIKILSQTVADKELDMFLGAFLSGRGTLVHPINQSSEAYDIFLRLISDDDYYSSFENDPIYKNSKLYSIISDPQHLKYFEQSFMDVLNDNGKGFGNGITYGDLSTFDALLTKMNAWSGGTVDGKYFNALSPTQSDRGNISSLIVPKINVDSEGNDQSVLSNGVLVSKEFQEWILDQITAELERMQNARKAKVKSANYAVNSQKFNLWSTLPKPVNIDLVVDKFKYAKLAEKEFASIIENDVQYLIDNGILTVGKTLGGKALTYETTIEARKWLSEGFRGTLSAAKVHNFIANNYIYTYEQTLFHVGDMAHYAQNSEKKPYGQKVDMNKRYGLPFTPGTKLAVGDFTGAPKTAKIKVVSEPLFDSESAEIYSQLYPESMFKDKAEQNRFYKNIELADGTGIVSLNRYKYLMMARGLHTREIIEAIDILNSWKPGMTDKKVSTALEVLKEFYFKLQPSPDGYISPFNMKYAVVPAIPQLYEKQVKGKDVFPGMAKISRELRSGRADEVVMNSAVKVGAMSVGTIDTLKDTPSITIFNDSVRFPQISPSKKGVESGFGSQIRKIIEGNYDPAGVVVMDGKIMSEKDGLNLYENTLSRFVNSMGAKADTKFIKGGKVDSKLLLDAVLSDLESSTFSNVEYYMEALQMINNQPMLPLNYPTLAFKIDSIINASYRSVVNKLQLPGMSAVQISSVGTVVDQSGISIGSDLSFVGFMQNGERLSKEKSIALAQKIRDGIPLDEDITIAPAEIRVTPKFFLNKLKKIAKARVNQKNIKEEVRIYGEDIKEANPNIDAYTLEVMKKDYHTTIVADEAEILYTELMVDMTDHKGNLSLEKIKAAGLAEIVMYRIPTQGKNSMLTGTIKEFLPESMGGTIQVPAEIVTQSGADFDIDKLYIENRDFYVDNNNMYRKFEFLDKSDLNTNEAKSAIFEYHRAVLSSPTQMQELLLPNNTDTLKKIATDFGVDQGMYEPSWGSIALQEIFRNNNRAGKALISVASLASVAHSIAPHIGSHYIGTKPLIIAGVTPTLGEKRSRGEGSPLISAEIGEIQNGALDNTKNPILGELNMNIHTANAVHFMLAHGYGLKFSFAIINAPIVKAIVPLIDQYTKSYGKENAFKRAKAALRKTGKYNFTLSDKKVNEVDLSSYTEEKVLKALTDPNMQKDALQVFKQLTELGNKLFSFQVDMNFDSKGTPSTVHEAIDKYVKLAAIPGTVTNRLEKSAGRLVPTGRTPARTRYASRQSMLDAMAARSVKVVKKADDSAYVVDGKIYERASEYVYGKNQKVTKAMEEATVPGTLIDTIGREFLVTGKMMKSPLLSPEAAVALEKVLTKVKDRLEARGESIITDRKYLVHFDEKLKVAGEMDIVTIDKDRRLRIYDMKSMKKSSAKEYGDNPKYFTDRHEKHGKQLNIYRDLLRNSLDIEAVELFIIPIKIDYDSNGYITSVTDAKYDGKDDIVVHHPNDSVLMDSRNFEITKGESLLKAYNITNKKEASFGVEPILYDSHSMASFEVNSLHRPIKVSREVSISASNYVQQVLSIAKEELGDLSPKTQSKLISEIYAYLVSNNLAVQGSKPGIADYISSGRYLELSDENNPSSTGNLIEQYRAYVANNKLQENGFIKALTILSKDGRKYVTFNNSKTGALVKEVKAGLMFDFEVLLASRNPLERAIAKSLALYGISHYGFSRSINSFQEILPPSVHTDLTAMGGTTLAEFFRNLKPKLNDDELMPYPYAFLDAFVANNYGSLDLEYLDGGEGRTMADFISETLDDDRGGDPTRYVLEYNRAKKDTVLWAYNDTTGKYEKMQKKGVPNLIKEYDNLPGSRFNENVSQVSMDSTNHQEETGTYNKGAIYTIENRTKVINYLVQGLKFESAETRKDAEKMLALVAKRLQDQVAKDADGFINRSLERIPAVTEMIQKKAESLGNNKKTYGERFSDAMDRTLKEMLVMDTMYSKLVTKILNCN